jgi:diamine N-acetyltransferase
VLDISLVPWRVRERDVLTIEVTEAQLQQHFIDGTVAEFLADDDDQPTFNSFAICEGQTVVGLICCGQEADHETWKWWIPLLVVDHRHQNRGLGRAAMRAVIQSIRAEAPDARALGLSCKPDNSIALGLYRSLGSELGEANPRGGVDMWLALR